MPRITSLSLALPIMCCVVLPTVGTAKAVVLYSEDFTSGASVDTLANPWTIWFPSTATPPFNFPIGTVPDGDKGVLAPGPAVQPTIDASRAVAAIAVPASFDPLSNDYTLSYDIYVPAIGSGTQPSNQLGIGFATEKPSTSSVTPVGLMMVVSNPSNPLNESYKDSATGIGGDGYVKLVPDTHNATFMGTTVHATLALEAATGTFTTTATGAGGATSSHSQTGLFFAGLNYIMMYTEGDGGYLSNIVLQTGLPASPILAGDYNSDGHVDAADYVAWRSKVGQPLGTLPNDGSGASPIGAAQYDQWRSHFGSPPASSAALGTAFVPEPSSLFLLVVCLTGLRLRRRRSRQVM